MSLLKRIVIIFFLFFFSIKASSDDKIFYVNIDFLITNSEYGKKIIEDLELLKKKNLQSLNIDEKEILKLEKVLNSKKNLINENDFQTELRSLQEKIFNFREKKIDIDENFEIYKNDKLNEFFMKINPLIKDYMAENSINLLFDKKNIFIGKSNYDITNDIIDLINNHFKDND